jgi:hypothetical protein
MKAGKLPVIAVLLALFSFSILSNSVLAFAPYSGGAGSAGNPYQISTVDDLLYLATHTGDYGKHFILTADIDLDPNLPGRQVFTTAVIASDANNANSVFDGNSFSGVFDGNGFTISNLTIDTNGVENDYLGLFGEIDSGSQIKNLGLEKVRVTGGNNSDYLGALAGETYGDINDCYSTGTVTSGIEASIFGGLAGMNFGHISNCHSTGNISGGEGSGYLGGLVGYEAGTISNCYATGNINGGYMSIYLGGLAGYKSSGTISNSYSTSDVNSGDNSQRLGGLVGTNVGQISNCHSTGKISGGNNSFKLGGLVGWNTSSGDISNCYSTGNTSGGDNSYKLGGLAGENSVHISNCHSSGNVSGSDDANSLGGLVGFNVAGGIIGNCFSSGNVSSGINSQRLGGLVGFNDSSYIRYCYSTGNAAAGGDDSQNIGGLVGDNGSGIGNILSCYSTGNANGGGGTSQNIGGLVGNNNGTIYGSYSTGTAGGGAAEVDKLVGYHSHDGNTPDDINGCYFLGSKAAANGVGHPLTSAKMKQQKSFVSWDFDGTWWIAEGTSYPKLFWQLMDVTKCTVTAGSKANKDQISFSGTMDANAGDFNDANNVIKVTVYSDDIVNPCDQNFPINGTTFKKGRYNYSRTVGGVRKSFTYDVKTHKFTFAASNLNLLGLYCPVTAAIDINDFSATAQIDETIVNGTRMPIPITLMAGVKDVLRVDKCTVKQNSRPNKDQLTVNGAFAVKDPNISMATRASENLVITLDSQQFDIPAISLKPKKDYFTCSNAPIAGGTAAATFNFKLCSFTLTIKDANIPPISGAVDFGVAFADFNEVQQVIPQ